MPIRRTCSWPWRVSPYPQPLVMVPSVVARRSCRRFLALAALLLITAGRSTLGQGAAPAQSDPKTGLVKSSRFSYGVPLGGIGAGSVQIMTDGAFSGATYNNNWAYPIHEMKGCFAAVWTRTGNRPAARVLALTPGYGLPGVKGIEYDGLFPKATLRYAESELPISVSMRAFSPLIPRDIRNSSFPGATLLVQLRNTSPNMVEAAVALSWENTLGAGGAATIGPFDERTGNMVTPIPDRDGFFAARMSGRDSAAPGSAALLGDERLRVNSLGDMTLMAAPERAQAIVTQASWNALDSKPGWWQTFAENGKVEGSVGAGVAQKNHPAAVLCVHIVLKPRESVDLPFAIAWSAPHLQTLPGGDYGHYYHKLFPDSYAAAHGLLAEWRSLLALTEEWQNRLLFSNLPRWMVRRLINSASPIVTHSVFTADETFVMLAGVGGRPPSSAPGDTQLPSGMRLASLRRRVAYEQVLTDLFPSLAARELRLYMARQAVEGVAPTSLGDLDRVLGMPAMGPIPAVDESLRPSPGPLPPIRSADQLDANSLFVLQFARYLFQSGDRAFLHLYLPNIRRSMETLLQSRAADGLPNLPTGSLTSESASLFLAALQAGGRMARVSERESFYETPIAPGLQGPLNLLERMNGREEDLRLSRNCDEALRLGSVSMQRRFPSRNIAQTEQYGKTLIGLSLSDSLGADERVALDPLEPTAGIVPPGSVQSMLMQIEADMSRKPQAPAAGRDAAGTNSLDIADMIFGVTRLAVSRHKPEFGVALLSRLDELRAGSVITPWASPDTLVQSETGLLAREVASQGGEALAMRPQSTAHASDWTMLSAVEGFTYDLTSGQMSLAPSVPGPWRSLRAPLFTPTFWGRIEWRPRVNGGVTTLFIDRLIALPAATATRQLSGSPGIELQRIRVAGPPAKAAGALQGESPVAHVSRGTTPIGVKSAYTSSGDLVLTFETPVKLTAGDRLEVDLH